MKLISNDIKNMRNQRGREKGSCLVFIKICLLFFLFRWDLQRARSLSQHQYLLDRYKRIHEKNSKPPNQKQHKKPLETFKPKMDQSM